MKTKLITGLFAMLPAAVLANSLIVHKSPTCGCCVKWIESFSKNITIQEENHHDMNAIKAEHGVPQQAASCHTAVDEHGFVYEGHVPPKMVEDYGNGARSHNGKGLVVPGMPIGSVGMDYDDRFQPYVVYELLENGSGRVYAEIDSKETQAKYRYDQ